MRVKDTGIGISEKYLKKIFDPFFQVDYTYARKYKGTGLGLTVCRGIIEQHDGKIWAESEFGKGSTFCFTLPLESAGPLQTVEGKGSMTKMLKQEKEVKNGKEGSDSG